MSNNCPKCGFALRHPKEIAPGVIAGSPSDPKEENGYITCPQCQAQISVNPVAGGTSSISLELGKEK